MCQNYIYTIIYLCVTSSLSINNQPLASMYMAIKMRTAGREMSFIFELKVLVHVKKGF